VLAAACRDHELVRFSYTARDDAATRREVEPHTLVNAGRRWYLAAWDRGREGWRTFRVDRIARPSAASRFTPRQIPGGDPAAFVERSLRTAPQRYQARVTVQAPVAELQGRRWLGGSVVPVDAERCEYRTSDDNLEWLAMRIAMLPGDYVVHEPPELIERLRGVAERITRATS
jgi:predicted DNA-binding transcriptional regulator YafY